MKLKLYYIRIDYNIFNNLSMATNLVVICDIKQVKIRENMFTYS